MLELEQRLKERLGDETELRFQASQAGPIVWVRLIAGDSAYWVGLPLTRPSDELPTRVMMWGGIVLIVLLMRVFSRADEQPVARTAGRGGRSRQGRTPAPLSSRGDRNLGPREGFQSDDGEPEADGG
jgi:hypothetical protein